MTDLALHTYALPSLGVENLRSPAGNGTTLVIFREGSGTYLHSTDGGANWTTRTNPLAGCDDALWNGSYFVTIYNGTCAKSTDGISWTTGTLPTTDSNSQLAWSGAEWVVTRRYSGSGSVAPARSTDGLAWTTTGTMGSTDMDGINVLWDGARFCALGRDDSDGFYYFFTSPTGTTWTQRARVDSGTAYSFNNGMAWNGSRYIIAGNVIIYSSDGITWSETAQPVDYGVRIHGVSGGYFLIVDTDYKISTNGSAWTTIVPTLTGPSATFGRSMGHVINGSIYMATDYSFNPGRMGVFTITDAIPPFWTSLVGSREVI